jgi:uncharacterized protein YjbI with pentapeptide repeats
VDRCNVLCTKDTTGTCAACEAWAEADRFFRFWFQGGLFVDGVHAMQRRGVFTFLRRYAFPLVFFSCVGLMLWLAWFIPRSAGWRSAVSRFVHENPVFVVALLISLVVPLFWLFLWKLPQWKVTAVPEKKDRIDLELKSRQTSIQIVGLVGGLVGGVALVGGLYFTAQTLRTSQETLRVNQETLQTTQEGQITERFTKAIDQLGKKDDLAVRLGGIYALERIARDSAKDHWQVMEVLTAFVREHQHQGSKTPADIQAILTVVGRRTRTFGNGETQRLNLSNANLQGAYLARAQLQQANLEGAQLQQANLEGAQLWKANFAQAQLQRAYLAEAQLQEAFFVFAQLQGANFTQAQLWKANFGQAQLQGANLQGAQLQSAFFGMAKLHEAHLAGVKLQGANLQQAQLQKTYLVKGQLQHAYLGFAQLQGADLTNAELQGADLVGAQLQGANLTGAQLQGAELVGAQLQGADLARAQLQDADLGFAPTRSSGTGSLAKMTDTSNYRIQLPRADLTGARLQGADLGTAKNLTQEQIDAACVDQHTQIPEGFSRPVPCPTSQP